MACRPSEQRPLRLSSNYHLHLGMLCILYRIIASVPASSFASLLQSGACSMKSREAWTRALQAQPQGQPALAVLPKPPQASSEEGCEPILG
eukprot:4608829-Amphidinium_carterae.1